MIRDYINSDISVKMNEITKQNEALTFITIATVLGQTISAFTNTNQFELYVESENEIKKIQLELESRLCIKDILLMLRDKMAKKDFVNYFEGEDGNQLNKILLYHTKTHKDIEIVDGFLTIGIEQTNEGYALVWQEDIDNKYWSAALESFRETFMFVLEQSVEDINVQLREIKLIRDESKIIDLGKGKEVSYEIDLLGQISKVVKENPYKTAVTTVDGSMSYSEIWNCSGKLASILMKKGVCKGDRVAIFANRSLETIVGILAIIKIGAAYVPIEPDYGVGRIEYMIKDSGCKLMLASANAAIKVETSVYYIDFNVIMEHNDDYQQQCECGVVNRYVIYTSGSTGKPKGVEINNEQLMNLCNWYINETKIKRSDKLLLLNAFGFDASVKNIFSSFITGCELILGSEYLFDFEEIIRIIKKNNVTMLNCVPSLFYELINIDKMNGFEVLKNLNLIVLGGEAIERRKIKEWFENDMLNFEIMNVYGPTECTSVSTFELLNKDEINAGKDITIGIPTYNKQLYVIDGDKRICPMYAKGELCISGMGTIDSYIGEFQNSRGAFSNDLIDSLSVLYHTGDIAYWNSDGKLVFVGRKDTQVKIDGHRIELGEIEQAIMKCYSQVEQCCVLLIEDNLHKKLVAHIVVDQDEEQSFKMDNKLQDWLPNYMIPKKVICHNAFPLTTNGKIDYKKLLTNSKEKAEITDTLNNQTLTVEEQVANIWRKLLGVNDVNYDENFFDAGGYSLLLYKLSKMLEKELACNVTFVELMTYTTISTFSEYIEGKMQSDSVDSKRLAKLKLKEMKLKRKED